MGEIFLSASIPLPGRGLYYETANPFLIQCAVREFVLAVIRKHRIVWGGHPAITPMIWSICEDLEVDYSQSVVLYQSKFFEDCYPEENKDFKNVVYVDAMPGNQDASLQLMREEMFSRKHLTAAVFIGGMDGVEVEYHLFRKFHPTAKILPVASPGGAALDLARDNGYFANEGLKDVDYATMFYDHLIKEK